MGDMTLNKKANTIVYLFQVVLAAVFLIAAFAKLSGDPVMVAVYEKIGFGQWFRYLTGVLEVAGAAILLTRSLSGLAALGLAAMMLVAAVLGMGFVSSSPWFWSIRLSAGIPFAPNVLLVACLLVAWARRGQFARFA